MGTGLSKASTSIRCVRTLSRPNDHYLWVAALIQPLELGLGGACASRASPGTAGEQTCRRAGSRRSPRRSPDRGNPPAQARIPPTSLHAPRCREAPARRASGARVRHTAEVSVRVQDGAAEDDDRGPPSSSSLFSRTGVQLSAGRLGSTRPFIPRTPSTLKVGSPPSLGRLGLSGHFGQLVVYPPNSNWARTCSSFPSSPDVREAEPDPVLRANAARRPGSWDWSSTASNETR